MRRRCRRSAARPGQGCRCRIIQVNGLSSSRAIGVARAANSLASRSLPRQSACVGGGAEQVGELIDVADLAEQRGGPVDALAQLGDARTRRWPSRADASAIVPVVAGGARPVERLVGERVRDIEPLGLRSPRATRIWSAWDRITGSPSARAIGLRLGQDRGLLGSAPQRPQAPAPSCAERADAQRRMGVGAAAGSGPGRSSPPRRRSGFASPSSRRARPPSRARARRSAAPTAQPRAAWRLSISASSRARCSLRARAPERPFGSVALGPARGSSGSGARARRRSSAADGEALGGVGADRFEHRQPGGRRARAGGGRAGSWRPGGRACRGRRA